MATEGGDRDCCWSAAGGRNAGPPRCTRSATAEREHLEPITEWQWVPVSVLLVAIVMESFSLRTAVVASNRERHGASWVDFVRRAKAPELPVVLNGGPGGAAGARVMYPEPDLHRDR